MATFASRLKELRLKKELTQSSLAKSLSIGELYFAPSTIGMWEQGKRTPPLVTLELIADFFNVDINYLTGKSNETLLIDRDTFEPFLVSSIEAYPLTTQRIPLLGSIACGYATDPGDTFRDEYIEIQTTKTVNADYALTASGDSMTGSNIYDGDIVLIHQQPDVNDGEIAAVLVDDETTLKIIDRSIPGYLLLKPDNAKFKTIAINIEKMEQEERNIRILGKAIAVQHLL